MPLARGLPSVSVAEGLAGAIAPFSPGLGRMAIVMSCRILPVGRLISTTLVGPTTIAMHGMAVEVLVRESCTSPKGLGAGRASDAAVAPTTNRRETTTSRVVQTGLPVLVLAIDGPNVRVPLCPICGRGPRGPAVARPSVCSSGTP